MIPITSARSGANFCFALVPASEGGKSRRQAEEREKREVAGVRKGEAGKVLKPCLAAMLGKCQWCYLSLRERERGRDGEGRLKERQRRYNGCGVFSESGKERGRKNSSH